MQRSVFSVDWNLVLFKGRLSFIQYIKLKRATFGIKLFPLCTSSGIPLDLVPRLVEMGEGLMTERIPATLMERYLYKGHISSLIATLRLIFWLNTS